MKVYIKLLREGAVIPFLATSGSAGYDVCACIDEEIVILVGDTVLVPTGLSVAFEGSSACMQIYSRSGLAARHGIVMANGVGIIDSDYRGEVVVPLMNLGKASYTIEKGQRIAQMLMIGLLQPTLMISEELPETERGSGGLGSTGEFAVNN